MLVRLVDLVRAVEGARESERVALQDAELAQRQLEEQNDRLREVDRLKDEFVSSVSHELRTPLTSISGYVELLAEDEAEPEKREYLTSSTATRPACSGSSATCSSPPGCRAGSSIFTRVLSICARSWRRSSSRSVPEAEAADVDLHVHEAEVDPADRR